MKTESDWKVDLAAYRRKNFAVNVTKARFRTERGELDLSVTHNGYQWITISLSREEVPKVIAALRKALK